MSCDVTVREQNSTNLLSNLIWMFVSLFTERRRLQRQICSSSSVLKTADWRVGSISVWCNDFPPCTFVTSPLDVTVRFSSLNKFWAELSRCSVSLKVCFCVCDLNPLFPPSEGPSLFCRSSHLEEQREQWEERRSALRQVHITSISPCLAFVTLIPSYHWSLLVRNLAGDRLLTRGRFAEDISTLIVSTGVPQETQGRQEEAKVLPEELRIMGFQLDFIIRSWRIPLGAILCFRLNSAVSRWKTWTVKKSSRSSEYHIYILFW